MCNAKSRLSWRDTRRGGPETRSSSDMSLAKAARHARTQVRRRSSSPYNGTPDRTALQSQSFYRRYGSILPTSLTYICLSARGYSPWRPAAVIGTTQRGFQNTEGKGICSSRFPLGCPWGPFPQRPFRSLPLVFMGQPWCPLVVNGPSCMLEGSSELRTLSRVGPYSRVLWLCTVPWTRSIAWTFPRGFNSMHSPLKAR